MARRTLKLMKFMGILAFHGLMASILPLPVAASVIPLEDAKRTLKPAYYSQEERLLLVRQLELIFTNLYVNRDLKVQDFGPPSDPLPRLASLRNDMKSLSSEEFSARVADVFVRLHDLHTSYQAPAPYGCGTTFIPVFFEALESEGSKKIFVGGKAKLSQAGSEMISIGDELLKVDGKEVLGVLESLDDISGGANPDAMRVRSLELLSMRPFGAQPLPQGSSVQLTLRSPAGIYQVVLDWRVLVDEGCLAGTESKTESPEIFTRWLAGGVQTRFLAAFSPEETVKQKRKSWAKSMVLSVDPFQDKFNEIFGHKMLAENPLEDDQPLAKIFEMQMIRTPAGKLGYIRLKSFFWEDDSLEVGVVVETFRRELERRYSDNAPGNASQKVSGLIIDVRGNPGGIILFAERIVQLFAPVGVDPTTVQMLANELNKDVFINSNGGTNRWSQGVQDALEKGSKYTAPEAITPKSEANKLGQIWFKPVVVLTDASCYSACDLFAAGMQDALAAKIIGIHRSTGAGGANVMEYTTFQAIMEGSGQQPFENLPHGQNFGISWRQTIRAGKNVGKLLENYGVESDVVVPLSLGDLGKESRQLMRRIHEELDEMAPERQSGLLALESGHRINLLNGEGAVWEENVWGVDELTVENGSKVIARIEISRTEGPVPVRLALPELKAEWQDQPLVLNGLRDGRQVFRVVRELSWRGEYVPVVGRTFAITFDDGDIEPLKVETLQGAEGWSVVQGRLRIGKGPAYGSRVLTRAFLPLSLEGRGAKLSFDASLEAEEINDSLRIYLMSPEDGQRVDIFAGSSLPKQRGVEVSIPGNLGLKPLDKVEVVFEFESDENWNLEGPVLDNIKVRGR